jgi:cytochrome c-type biogenesis protein CcmE
MRPDKLAVIMIFVGFVLILIGLLLIILEEVIRYFYI